MSGEKPGGAAGTSGGGQTVDVPILGLLQTDGETRDYTNDTSEKLPKVCRNEKEIDLFIFIAVQNACNLCSTTFTTAIGYKEDCQWSSVVLSTNAIQN